MVHRFVALGALILVVVFVSCVLGGEHGVGDEACSALAVASIGVAVVSGVTLTGRVLPGATESYRLCPADPLAPPPRA